MAERGSMERHSQSYNHTIDVCVSKSSGPRCETVGIVSRRLSVCPSLYTCVLRRTCTCTCWLSTCALHGYCDYGTRACFLKILQHLVGSAQAISAHGKVVHVINTFYFAPPCPVTHVIMDRHLHGITSDGLLPKIHTLDEQEGHSWLL